MRRVYTDGSSNGSRGPGGWGWISETGETDFGGALNTTNQRMEMYAAIEALRSNSDDVTIVSDSQYVINCFNQRWYLKWKRNGWKNGKGEPVANQDLWETLLALLPGRIVQWEWVKGHSGNLLNEQADRLAVQGKGLTNV